MSTGPTIAPWQLWLVDFGVPHGSSEQGGSRPAVIVGSDDHCRFPIRMAIVVPLTTRDRGLPHHVEVGSAESGLRRPSWARTDDLRAVSTGRFTREAPLGELSGTERAEVGRWVRRMLA